ncbi:U4/U6 small nuclear ribonucleoprotein Prp31, partial [Cladochytrium tenue]
MDEDLLHDLDDLDGDEAAADDVGSRGALGADDGDDEEDVDQMDADGDDDGDGDSDGDPEAAAAVERMDAALRQALREADVSAIAKLLSSKSVKDLLARMENFKRTPRPPGANTGPVEEDPEYSTLVAANNLLFDIDSEILLVHKYTKERYAARFSELESLVPNALEYARVVKAIGNEMDLMKVDLKALLPSATVMIVTVTSTTTSGKPLPPDELDRVYRACDLTLELEAAKRSILDYVESRMSFLAPNLAAIVGSTTAAKLMGVAGGLAALSKIPACNLVVLGKPGRAAVAAAGVTSAVGALMPKGQLKHAGIVYSAAVVASAPKDFRVRAARMVSAKCCLAARIDRARQYPDGAYGRAMRDEIVAKLDKAQEPPPTKQIKALPVPEEGRKVRRGGKKARRMKEKYAVTDAQKAQNRVRFGEAEEEVIVGDTVRGLGLLGAGSSGRVRGFVADPNKK